MALLSIDEEIARAARRTPFSNRSESNSWMNLWCEECVHNIDCPLIMVTAVNRTPAAWVEREPHGLNRYTCREYQDVNEPTQVIA